MGLFYARPTLRQSLSSWQSRHTLAVYSLSHPQNDSEAQNNLGIMFEDGIGVPQDLDQAVTFYSMSAQQNNVNGYFNLGLVRLFKHVITPPMLLFLLFALFVSFPFRLFLVRPSSFLLTCRFLLLFLTTMIALFPLFSFHARRCTNVAPECHKASPKPFSSSTGRTN